MADISIFRHWDLQKLQAMLAGAQSAVSSGSGQIIVQYSIGGREVQKMNFLGTQEDFINAVNWALEFKDPDQYPPLIDRTRMGTSRWRNANGDFPTQ